MDSMIQAVSQATLVSTFVLLLLVGMSVASWAYICGKWLTLLTALSRATEGLMLFDEASRLSAALPIMVVDERSPFSASHGVACASLTVSRTPGDIERLLNDNIRRELHFGIAKELTSLKSSWPSWPPPPIAPPYWPFWHGVSIMHSFTYTNEKRVASNSGSRH